MSATDRRRRRGDDAHGLGHRQQIALYQLEQLAEAGTNGLRISVRLLPVTGRHLRSRAHSAERGGLRGVNTLPWGRDLRR